MSTVRMPLGVRKNQLIFQAIDHLYDKTFNPKYKLERIIFILSVIEIYYVLSIFFYKTILVFLLLVSVFLIYNICKLLNNDGPILIYIRSNNKWVLNKVIYNK